MCIFEITALDTVGPKPRSEDGVSLESAGEIFLNPQHVLIFFKGPQMFLMCPGWDLLKRVFPVDKVSKEYGSIRPWCETHGTMRASQRAWWAGEWYAFCLKGLPRTDPVSNSVRGIGVE